jgi:glycosyltransferase involved in cell wall biosynthesis
MNKTVPLVSVVMPVCNVEKYIDEAIVSVLNQTFSDFEFIIIDDGSEDNTWNILQTYTDDRIMLLRNAANIGNYPSRNRGIRVARGKYIAVMDGDDIAMPDRLEKQYLHLEAHPDLMAIGSYFMLSTETKKYEPPLTHEDICFALLRSFNILHPSFMILTKAIHSLDGYNETYQYASDYDLLCRLSLTGRIEILPDILMTYRKHESQISQSKVTEQSVFALTVRRKYQVAFINKFKTSDQDPIDLPEVGIPEIGLAICYYTYAKRFNEKKYQVLADRTVEVVYKIITKEVPVCIENGLCGLGCGLHYLIKNGFLDGDINEVLDDIDQTIVISFENNRENEHRQDILFYLDYRISNSDYISTEKKNRFMSLLLNKV